MEINKRMVDKLQTNNNKEVAICDLKSIEVEPLIHTIRGQQVILDRDLANLTVLRQSDLMSKLNEILKGFRMTLCFNFQQESLKIGSRKLRLPIPTKWGYERNLMLLQKVVLLCLVVYFGLILLSKWIFVSCVLLLVCRKAQCTISAHYNWYIPESTRPFPYYRWANISYRSLYQRFR